MTEKIVMPTDKEREIMQQKADEITTNLDHLKLDHIITIIAVSLHKIMKDMDATKDERVGILAEIVKRNAICSAVDDKEEAFNVLNDNELVKDNEFKEEVETPSQ